MKAQITDAEAIAWDPFIGDESVLTLRTVRVRTARKQHACFFSGVDGRPTHAIEPGTRYREERALVDGDFFGRYCMCLPCIAADMAAVGDDECDGDEE